MKRCSLEHVAETDALVALDLLNMTTSNLRHAEDHMLLLGRKTSLERVAAFLLRDGPPPDGRRRDGPSDVSSRYRRLSRPDARNGIPGAVTPSRHGYPRLPRPDPAANRVAGPDTVGGTGPLGRSSDRYFASGQPAEPCAENSRRRCPMLGTVFSRQSGRTAAIVLRSARAIQPSFSPCNTGVVHAMRSATRSVDAGSSVQALHLRYLLAKRCNRPSSRMILASRTA